MIPSRFDEKSLDKSIFPTPADFVVENCRCKAEEVKDRLLAQGEHFDLLIASDTVVVHGTRILEKPESEVDAKEMLMSLSGSHHKVVTGVTLLLRTSSGEYISEKFSEETEVHFATVSEKEVSLYVATKEPMDKAGGYGIQGQGAVFVKSISGDYHNVVGFPLHKFAQTIGVLMDTHYK